MLTLMTLPTTVGGWIGFVAIIVVIAVLLGISIYTTIRLVKTGHMNEIKDAIAGAVAEAEKTHKTGAEKKEIAMNAMKVYCEKIGVHVSDWVLKLISDWIDKYILDHNTLEDIEEDRHSHK